MSNKHSRTDLILKLAKRKQTIFNGNAKNMWNILNQEIDNDDYVANWVQGIPESISVSENDLQLEEERHHYTELLPAPQCAVDVSGMGIVETYDMFKTENSIETNNMALMEEGLDYAHPPQMPLWECAMEALDVGIADGEATMDNDKTENFQPKSTDNLIPEETEKLQLEETEKLQLEETEKLQLEETEKLQLEETEKLQHLKTNDTFQPELKKRKRSKINQREMNKKLKYEGKSYETRNNKKIDDKKVKPGCNEKCKLQCTKKILDEQRASLFTAYWSMGDLQRQREYIKDNVEKIHSKYPRIAINKKRNRDTNFAYFFQVDGQKVRVCQSFFKATLDINSRVIQTVRQKIDQNTGILASDKRGISSNNAKKMPSHIVNSITEHINSLPRIESHYCRKRTSFDYIEGGKTVADLHRDYDADQKLKGKPSGTYDQYRKIFQQYKIKFFVPKKDQCEECVAFNLLPKEKKEQEKIMKEHAEHVKQKELSREEKRYDKEDTPETTLVFVYDLQAVLNCPQGEASPFYYVSKLGVYNFTICNIKNMETTCYVWDETQGKRGSTEIGTCVLKFLQSLNDKTPHNQVDIIFYSDNCCGQHKNKYVQSVYHLAVQTLQKINSICHKYLIRGHTQNEGDAIHSVIERHVNKTLKSSPIYHPSQYFHIIRTAKKTNKLNVVEMSHTDFLNLKYGPTLKMHEVHVILVEKKEKKPYTVKIKNTYGSEFQEIIPAQSVRKKKEDKVYIKSLASVYPKPLPVADKKKEGLLGLLTKGVVPKCYQAFYESI